ncbi:unnamed protein product, partial [Mesorhabditis spiculigera]
MENGNLMTKCKPSLFCEDLKSPATDCIRAVEYNVGTDDVRMVLFPFNLCTPALKQEGGCDNGESTVPPYDPASPHYGIEYYYQCDAGFTVPKDVADPEQGCVPNLLMAAGFGTVPEVPIPGDGLPYENPSFKFCAFNEKPAGETPCEPVPLCELTRPASFDESKIPTNPCFKICKYSSTVDEECVPLEILDGEHVISAYRRGSGPYAELLTDEETLQLDFAPTDAIKYPKCVKAEKLSEDQQKLVAVNRFLNCDLNPFYDAGNNLAMMLEPVDCKEGEDPKKFLCIPAATTTKEPASNSTTTPSTTTSMFFFGFFLGTIFGVMLMIGVVAIWHLFKKKPPRSSPDLTEHRSSPKMQHGSKESAPASNRSPEHSIVDKPKQLVKSLMQAVSKKPSLDKSKELSKDRTRKLKGTKRTTADVSASAEKTKAEKRSVSSTQNDPTEDSMASKHLPRPKLGNKTDILEEQERAIDDFPSSEDPTLRMAK